jgi:predicted component of type VI protein secretion system
VIGHADGLARERLGPPRLVVINGALAGATVALDRDETTIGRAGGNDVVLPDVAVSRRHAVLRREGNGYIVVDRASGNGTRINGRTVVAARLRDGDEIAVGDSLVQFVDAGGIVARNSVAVAPAVDRQRVRGTSMAIGLPLLAIVVCFWSVKQWVHRSETEPIAQTSQPPPARGRSAEACEADAPAAPSARQRVPEPSRSDVVATVRAEAHATGRADGKATRHTDGRANRAARSRTTFGEVLDEPGREQLQGVAAEANDAYLRGYVAKDIDEDAAREAFRSVVELLPASDPTARKARHWLDRLDGKAGEED